MTVHHSILDVLVDIDAHHDLKIFLIEHIHRVMSEEVVQTLTMMIIVNAFQSYCDEKDICDFSEDELLLHNSFCSFYENFHHVFCLNNSHSFFPSD